MTTHPGQTKPALADVVTAMPWLSTDEGPQAIPTPAPIPSPEPAAALEPDITSEQTEQPTSDEVQPTPQESAAKDLLKKSWLSRQPQPEMKSTADSLEPMG